VADDYSHPRNEKIRKLRGQLRELAFLKKLRLVDFQQKINAEYYSMECGYKIPI